MDFSATHRRDIPPHGNPENISFPVVDKINQKPYGFYIPRGGNSLTESDSGNPDRPA
jgi:hypothetical protein